MSADGEPGERPNARDVAVRAVILKHVTVHSLTKPPGDALAKIMKSWSRQDQDRFPSDVRMKCEQFWSRLGALRSELSPWEQKFARTTMLDMADQDQIKASWRVEAFQVLLWALELVPELPPYDKMADHALLKRFVTGDPEQFVRAASLRQPQEIDRARDVAELWHWRSRTRQLIEEGRAFPDPVAMHARGFKTYDDIVRSAAKKAREQGTIPVAIDEDFPAFGKAYRSLTAKEWSNVRSITMERHFALNWLCGYAPGNRWDETPTDT